MANVEIVSIQNTKEKVVAAAVAQSTQAASEANAIFKLLAEYDAYHNFYAKHLMGFSQEICEKVTKEQLDKFLADYVSEKANERSQQYLEDRTELEQTDFISPAQFAAELAEEGLHILRIGVNTTMACLNGSDKFGMTRLLELAGGEINERYRAVLDITQRREAIELSFLFCKIARSVYVPIGCGSLVTQYIFHPLDNVEQIMLRLKFWMSAMTAMGKMATQLKAFDGSVDLYRRAFKKAQQSITIEPASNRVIDDDGHRALLRGTAIDASTVIIDMVSRLQSATTVFEAGDMNVNSAMMLPLKHRAMVAGLLSGMPISTLFDGIMIEKATVNHRREEQTTVYSLRAKRDSSYFVDYLANMEYCSVLLKAKAEGVHLDETSLGCLRGAIASTFCETHPQFISAMNEVRIGSDNKGETTDFRTYDVEDLIRERLHQLGLSLAYAIEIVGEDTPMEDMKVLIAQARAYALESNNVRNYFANKSTLEFVSMPSVSMKNKFDSKGITAREYLDMESGLATFAVYVQGDAPLTEADGYLYTPDFVAQTTDDITPVMRRHPKVFVSAVPPADMLLPGIKDTSASVEEGREIQCGCGPEAHL